MKNLTRGGRQILASIQTTPEVESFLAHPTDNKDPSLLNTQYQINLENNLLFTTLTSPLLTPLDGENAKHIISVLRVREGDHIRIIDPVTNLIGQGPLHSLNAKNWNVHIEVIGKSLSPYPHVLIGLPEQKTMESCIEKLTEIGVKSISFVQLEYSQVKVHYIPKERIYKKRDAAVKQSYSLCVPEILIFENIEKALQHRCKEGEKLITLYSPKDKEELNIKNVEINSIDSLLDYYSNAETPPTICIGPEGGFSKDELKLLINHKSSFLSLGRNTLRVETAATLAVACINAGSSR